MSNHRNASQYTHYDVIIIGLARQGYTVRSQRGRRGRRVLVYTMPISGQKNPHVRWRTLQLYQLLCRA
ncbi:hypothetical protein [Psychrobacter sp. WY6]|uniref:hypothetical protein n=1 Tax=Psychrobacter sp. WY6 TaxID=2708350 RepID=UPI002022F0C6